MEDLEAAKEYIREHPADFEKLMVTSATKSADTILSTDADIEAAFLDG